MRVLEVMRVCLHCASYTVLIHCSHTQGIIDDINEQFNSRQVQFLDPRVVMMFEPSGMLGQLGYGHDR
jgi:hypothetical protein